MGGIQLTTISVGEMRSTVIFLGEIRGTVFTHIELIKIIKERSLRLTSFLSENNCSERPTRAKDGSCFHRDSVGYESICVTVHAFVSMLVQVYSFVNT